MGAGHGHGHAGGRHRWRLAVAFGLVGSFFGVELAVGLWSGSLALLSDAGHMAADVVALGAALAATRIATMTDRTGRKTFGSYRAEVFASGLTVLLMLGAGTYVAVEGIKRIGETVELESGAVMLVGAIGLLINVIALALLRGGAGESINVKGAYLEVVADTVGSVGVIAAGVMIALTGNAWWDTGIALAIAAFVVVRAAMLGREVLNVLGQHAPAGMDPAEVEASLVAVDGVAEVHDLHLWALTSGMNVATAHLVAAPGASREVLVAAQATLREKYGVDHATLQIESDATACSELSW
ncbi:cation diffusion facilitator family transporter [Nocardioides sp. L-11A]|uniref:cation diffusion facilitator family transporter n=1 Tax=Nocardioides sp. L-11A TaxID=3043848 RepID=UPI002499B449|nr:cation diffusion facilitator family transporter [Nocardioides sp. L-11A]